VNRDPMKVIYRSEIPGVISMVEKISELVDGKTLSYLLLIATRKLAPKSCGVEVEVLEKKTRNYLNSKLPEGVTVLSLDPVKNLSFLNYCKMELNSAFSDIENDSVGG